MTTKRNNIPADVLDRQISDANRHVERARKDVERTKQDVDACRIVADGHPVIQKRLDRLTTKLERQEKRYKEAQEELFALQGLRK